MRGDSPFVQVKQWRNLWGMGNRHSAGPGGLLVTETREEAKISRPRMYRVLLHNDDFTTMDFVLEVLTGIFRKGEAEANQLMWQVHSDGACVAGVYPFGVAETKAAQVTEAAAQNDFPLLCTLEPTQEAP